jgi:hypothetical protein
MKIIYVIIEAITDFLSGLQETLLDIIISNQFKLKNI